MVGEVCSYWCSVEALIGSTWWSVSWTVWFLSWGDGIVKNNIMHARIVVGEKIGNICQIDMGPRCFEPASGTNTDMLGPNQNAETICV